VSNSGGFTAQYLHSTAWAMLLAVDDVFFLKPIPSGAMTKYLGQVRDLRGASVGLA
jgi:acyl-CoA hydrolase